jgi:hypothetical protein
MRLSLILTATVVVFSRKSRYLRRVMGRRGKADQTALMGPGRTDEERAPLGQVAKKLLCQIAARRG